MLHLVEVLFQADFRVAPLVVDLFRAEHQEVALSPVASLAGCPVEDP
jgi:hypothetical protein